MSRWRLTKNGREELIPPDAMMARRDATHVRKASDPQSDGRIGLQLRATIPAGQLVNCPLVLIARADAESVIGTGSNELYKVHICSAGEIAAYVRVKALWAWTVEQQWARA